MNKGKTPSVGNRRGLGTAAAALMIFGFSALGASSAYAQADVNYFLLSGDPTAASGTFQVGIELSGNTVGPLGGFLFRATYNSDEMDVTGLTVVDPFAFPATTLQPLQGTGAGAYRNFSGIGSGNPLDPNPNDGIFLILECASTATPMLSFPSSFVIADDPGAVPPTLITDEAVAQDITHVFNLTGSPLPDVPSNPSPADTSTGIDPNADLSWTSAGATSFDLTIWPSADPMPGSPTATGLALPFFDPGPLLQGTDYSWQVDASNAAGTVSGPTWTFTTGAGLANVEYYLECDDTIGANEPFSVLVQLNNNTATGFSVFGFRAIYDSALVDLVSIEPYTLDGQNFTGETLSPATTIVGSTVFKNLSALQAPPTNSNGVFLRLNFVTTATPPGTFAPLPFTLADNPDLVGGAVLDDNGDPIPHTFSEIANPGPEAATNPDPADGAIDVSLALAQASWDNTLNTESYEFRIWECGDPRPATATLTTTFDPGLTRQFVTIPGGFLLSDTCYVWDVTSIGCDGQQTVSAVFGFDTELAALGVPTNPDPANSATAILPSTNFDWDMTAGATPDSFEIRIWRAGDSIPVAPTGTSVSSDFDPPADLDLATNYFWQVTAIRGGDTSTGPIWNFQTSANTVPVNIEYFVDGDASSASSTFTLYARVTNNTIPVGGYAFRSRWNPTEIVRDNNDDALEVPGSSFTYALPITTADNTVDGADEVANVSGILSSTTTEDFLFSWTFSTSGTPGGVDGFGIPNSLFLEDSEVSGNLIAQDSGVPIAHVFVRTGFQATPTPTPTATPTETETPTPSPSETETPTPTVSPTASETETPTPFPSPTEPTPFPSPTEPTPFPSPTEFPSPTAFPSPTEPTPFPSPTEAASPTAFPSPTEPTPFPSPTANPTNSPNPTNTPNPTPTEFPSPTAFPSPTEPTPFPSPTEVVPTETPITFDFSEDVEGWTFFPFTPMTAAQGTHTAGSSPGGSLNIQAVNNTNSFAFWQSPAFLVVSSPLEAVPEGVIPIVGGIGDNYFVSTYKVQTDQSLAADAPTIRLRTTTDDASQSDVLVVESTGDGAFSPTNANAQEYKLYFKQAPGNSSFRFQFDLLNFAAAGAPTGTIRLDTVSVQRVDLASNLAAGQLESSWSFDSGADGWDFRTVESGFVNPTSSNPSGALAITTVDFPESGPTVQFGWWNGPESSSGGAVTLQPNRLYYGLFTVESSEATPNAVPSFRMRFNESGYQASQLTQAASNFDDARGALNVPTAGNPITYTVFFPINGANGRLLFPSFDLLSDVNDSDSTAATVLLNNVEIYSIPAP